MGISHWWRAPDLNPINGKARSIPVLNPINMYGRVFLFSWLGFFVAFLSWFAFPPLIPHTIKKDLNLTQNEIANSNILALTGTLLVRVIIGPLCDRFGPRLVFVGVLLVGAIPTALAACVQNASGLIVLRFFIGILGGSFVPCQVWCTGFFDKNIVGRANALAAGLGNAGGGVTYFVMPAIYDSLVSHQSMTPHKAWRIAFVVCPFLIIVAMALVILFLSPDTPNGSWKDRGLRKEFNYNENHVLETSPELVATSGGQVVDVEYYDMENGIKPATPKTTRDGPGENNQAFEKQDRIYDTDDIHDAETQVIHMPTLNESLSSVFSFPQLLVAAPYFCSFGTELAVNSILNSFYLQADPSLGQTGSGNFAAMFGLLNVVTRPLGGYISDKIYPYLGVEGKKYWMLLCLLFQGVFLLWIGVDKGASAATLIGGHAGLAVFVEAANGANFSLVPHIHPANNGVISGVTGAAGNFGGVIFALIFRYQISNYHRTYWIMSILVFSLTGLVAWISVPRGPSEYGRLGKPKQVISE